MTLFDDREYLEQKKATERRRLVEFVQKRTEAAKLLETDSPPVEVSAPKKKRAQRKKTPEPQSDYDRSRREEYTKRMEADPLRREIKPPTLPAGIKFIDQSQFDPTRLSLIGRAASNQISWPWLIWGNVGCGKTYLAAEVFTKFSGLKRWYSYSDFCSHCTKLDNEGTLFLTAFNGSQREFSRDTWWNGHIGEASLVVIDDLGTGAPSPQRNEIVHSLLERRKGKPLIFTSNFSIDNNDRQNLHSVFDDRVLSRIMAGTWQNQLPGHDRRLRFDNPEFHDR